MSWSPLPRFAGTLKALHARVAYLGGLGMAARLQDEGCGAGNASCSKGGGDGEHFAGGGRQARVVGGENVIDLAGKTADELIIGTTGGGPGKMTALQARL